jgi:hypothetical protein
MSSRIGKLFGMFLLIMAARVGAGPWSLMSCDPTGAAGWQDFESQMRAAKPGSTTYVPVPFPTTTDQIVQDYLYQYWSVIKGIDRKQWQPNEARVQADLTGGKVSYQVLRVENWTVSRCHKDQKRDFYYLVRVFEPGGIEVTRAVVNDSGLLTTWNNLPASVPGAVASQSRTLPPAVEAMKQLNTRLGINGMDAEYVVTFGTLSCPLTHPCLAFRLAGLTYLALDTQLFEISANGKRLKQGKEVGTPAEGELLQRLSADERLVSLGGDAFTIARRVEPARVRRNQSAFTR